MLFLVLLFFRLNLSRWTRRTRPTHWYLWPPCRRSPSTNPLSTGSLHQKMGPTPAPQLTGTLPVGPLWLILRCESPFHLLYRDTHPHRTPSMQALLLLQRPPSPSFFLFFFNILCFYMDLSTPVMSNIPFMIISYICCRIPFSFEGFQDTGVSWFLKWGYNVYMQTQNTKIQSKSRYSSPCKRMDINHDTHDHILTITAMPIMWKVEDHCAFRLTRGTSSVPVT